MSDLSFFLYRRLSRLITCKLGLANGATIDLDSKYQVASFQDVFLDPNYWQLFSLLKKEPKLIVDCGAHLGHFSILAEICIQSRFQKHSTEYIMVEPNSNLVRSLRDNIRKAKFLDRTQVINAAVGRKAGTVSLSMNKKNLLTSSTMESRGVQPIPYVDLREYCNERKIDVLKLDIEGSEVEFVSHNADIMKMTEIVIVEVHQNRNDFVDFDLSMRDLGFMLAGPIRKAQGNVMATYERQ